MIFSYEMHANASCRYFYFDVCSWLIIQHIWKFAQLYIRFNYNCSLICKQASCTYSIRMTLFLSSKGSPFVGGENS